ncbi:MAG: hypothetical protein JNJ55_08685 [Betaproteobacteria bacterium]|nr:hypothetical protein [Betaproteobacteria bacterium]
MSQTFLEELREQRWDDHRYYHHSRINQSLHFVSALSFIAGYAMLFFQPAMAALLCWLVGMLTRQSGHFFFEPKGYDHVNQATHAHKEEIKVGYNLQRKVVLMTVWALSPVVLWTNPTLWGIFSAHADWIGFLDHLGLMWIAIGVAAVLWRTVQLMFIRNVQTGLVWCTKILTDPFHDAYIYHKAPYYLMKGQWIDPHIATR